MPWERWFQSRRWEQNLDAELRFHIEQQIKNNIRAGDSPEEARRKALIEFGGIEQVKEECRDARGLWLLDSVMQDLRFAIRQLRKHPGFAAVVVLTLALGVGATTAVYSVVNAVLLRPLPFKNPERLAILWETDTKGGSNLNFISSGNFIEWRDRVSAFERYAASQFWYFNLTGRDEPEQVQGLRVTASFLPMFGAQPQLGRLFSRDDEQPGHEKMAVLSDALWRRRFAADRDIIGQRVDVEGEPYTVIGVLRSGFRFFPVLDRPLDLYVPLSLDLSKAGRQAHEMTVYAQVKEGTSMAQAGSELDNVYHELGRRYPETNATVGARVMPLTEAVAAGIRPTLALLLAAVVLVLMIACVNIANMMLARAVARQQEMAVRGALGASRSRLLRQTLTESLVLAFLGGLGGTCLALWGSRTLNRVIPPSVLNNQINDFELDHRVLGLALGISVLSGVIFGLAAALQSRKSSLNQTLKEGRRGSAGGRGVRRLGNLFVISEISLAVALLASALLLIRSSVQLQRMSRGLDLNNVLTMQVWLPQAKYPDGGKVINFYRDALQRIQRLPGVEAAGAINFPPLSPMNTGVRFTIEGRPSPQDGKPLSARYSVIDPLYFRTMRIPLLSGRTFTENDADEARGVVIISAAMARRFWPDENPIGRQIQPQFPTPSPLWDAESKNVPLTIVGVVGDVRENGPRLQGRSLPLIYLPYLQNPSAIMHFVVRTSANPLDMANPVRAQVQAIDGAQPVFDVKSMEDIVAETFERPRILAGLTGFFAAAALMLAAVGIYGLLSYSVGQRTHEIGVRMALGASRSSVLKMVVGQGLRLAVVGTVIGLCVSFALSRFLASMLFGVSTTDPITFSAVAFSLIGVAALAAYIPARRAARVDPMVALRAE